MQKTKRLILTCLGFFLLVYIIRFVIKPDIHFQISNMIYLVAGVGVSEEILFRGYFYQKIIEMKDSPLYATVISSLLFGMFHIYGGNLHQIISSVFFGMAFCLFRQKIKGCTLLSLILAHGIYDTLGIQVFMNMFH